jgi:thiol-disulfide isomerase/thioredoxin
MSINKTLILTISLLTTAINYCRADTILNFKVFSTKNSNYKVIIEQTVFNDYNGIQLASGKVDSLGQFSANLKLDKEREVTLIAGNQLYKLWLGDKGFINVFEEKGLLKFNGDYSKENEVLYLTKLMQPNTLPSYFAFERTQALEYVKMLDSLEETRLSLLNLAKNKLSALFFEYFKQEIVYFGLLSKSQFAALHKLKESELPSEYYKFWENFQVLPDGVKSKSYLAGFNDYAEFKIKQGFNDVLEDKAIKIKAQFKFLDSLLKNHPKTLEFVEGEFILFCIKYIDDTELITSLKFGYEERYPTSDYTKLIEVNWFKRNQQTLKKPVFSLKNTTGETVSVESFKGKVVYIDFWGSWCKACLLEMPSAKKLREKFLNDHIVFLYLDFYDTKDLWLRAIKTHEITGVNLKAEATDEKYFNDLFGIRSGFPRYAVLDKNGFLISTSAPSPSNEKVVDYLKKLL